MRAEYAIAFAIYFGILIVIGFLSSRKAKTATDFILGGRSLNFYVTALSAHASDMSNWLFMAYPAIVFVRGGVGIWSAIGLIFGFWANWQFVATRLRVETEKHGSLTLSAFFSSRFKDNSGILAVLGGLLSLFYFTVYVSAGLVGIGYLFETVFGPDKAIGMIIGISVVAIYTLVGGYLSIAWVDLFQALFLLLMIILVPLVALGHVGGFPTVEQALSAHGLSASPFQGNLFQIIFPALGWGLGYFGQTHILSKFMGIKHPEEIRKAKWVGMIWQVICLAAASLIGLVGVAYFATGLANDELVFILMVKGLFPAFFAGFILCAVLAATISTMDSQVIVLVSILTEDFYHRFIKRQPSEKDKVWASRVSVVLIAFAALSIALMSGRNVFELVFFAWSGLGSTFGAVLIHALYFKKTNRYGAIFGMVFGGLVAAFWPFPDSICPALIPGFLLNLFLISIVSRCTK